MRKSRILLVLSVILLVVGVVLSCFLLNFQGIFAGKTETVNVAYSRFESLGLFWIAEDQRFFNQNGLNVIPHVYNTGASALDGVLNGEADIAVGTNEFPLVGRALKQERIRTIGSISKSDFVYLVGRKDRGIERVLDLKGKKIGTTFGTIAQFFLGRFLNLNGVKLEDVNLIDLKTPEEWVDAVVNGDVDAVATAQPYADSAMEGLGANSFSWSVQNNQPLYTQAISTNDWITANPELVNKFLYALSQAEEYAVGNPIEAKAIVKKQMNFTDQYIDTVWKRNQFELSLSQSLILAMEGEASWLVANNLTDAKAIPNFLNFIYVEGLKTVKRESVSIIGVS